MSIFFFFNDTATTEIYTLSLHDALPICECRGGASLLRVGPGLLVRFLACLLIERSKPLARLGHVRARTELLDIAVKCRRDRKSTRLNSSHDQISYAVFCLKKNNNIQSCD